MALIVAVFPGLALVMLVIPASDLAVRIAPDDGFFYLVLARNAAEGVWSSFDGLEPTNGYHPLWFLVLTAVRLVVAGDEAFFRAALVSCAILYGVTAFTLWRTVTRITGTPAAGLLGASLFVLLYVPTSWYLTEVGLASCLMSGFLALALHDTPGSSTGRQLGMGAMAGALMLARLDTIFVSVPVLLAGPPSTWWTHRRLAFAAFLVLTVPYVASNLMVHGHLMPISGAIKGSFPVPVLTNLPLTPGRWVRLLIPLALCAVSLVVLGVSTAITLERPVRRVLAGASGGVLLFGVYELLFQRSAKDGLFSWHFGAPTLVGILCASAVLVSTRMSTGRARAVAILLIGASAVGLHGRVLAPDGLDRSLANMWDTAQWVRAHVPHTDVIAVTDPGIIAYFGGRRTIALDGLVNSFAYQDVLRSHALRRYLDARHVRHVVVKNRHVPRTYDAVDVFFEASLFGHVGDRLTFRSRDEVFRTADDDVVVWALSPASGANP